MTTYTVTIEPPARGEANGVVRAVLRVDIGDDSGSRIVEITLHSEAKAGLAAIPLPSIDLRAVVTALHAGISGLNDAGEIIPAASQYRDGHQTQVVESLPATNARAASNKDRQVPTSISTQSRTPSRAAGERAYRRMPDPNKLREDHARIGSITKLAEHYGVPRHTVKGWMRRLRKMDGSLRDSN